MLRRICFLLAMLLCGTSFVRISEAQLFIQQPIVQQFGVQTSVIVPDRGFLFLGGVSRAAHSRYSPGNFGPGFSGPGFLSPVGPCGCRGSSLGFEYQSTSLSVGVSILDLAEMDRQVLAEADGFSPFEPEFEGRPGRGQAVLRGSGTATGDVAAEDCPAKAARTVGGGRATETERSRSCDEAGTRSRSGGAVRSREAALPRSSKTGIAGGTAAIGGIAECGAEAEWAVRRG